MQVDMTKLQDFMGKLITDLGGAALAANMMIREDCTGPWPTASR